MDDEDRKRKRERNNESVRKCRQNEKKKIETARDELEKYKNEYTELEDKYTTLQKELQVLKSLFQSSAGNCSNSLVSSQTKISIQEPSISDMTPTNSSTKIGLDKKNTQNKVIALESQESVNNEQDLIRILDLDNVNNQIPTKNSELVSNENLSLLLDPTKSTDLMLSVNTIGLFSDDVISLPVQFEFDLSKEFGNHEKI